VPQNRHGRRLTFQLFMTFAPPEMDTRTPSTMPPTHQTLSHGILSTTESSIVGCWLDRVQELRHEKRHGAPETLGSHSLVSGDTLPDGFGPP
jgi:hypothetical protein